MKACDRCGGIGHIAAFKHVSGGVCFQCDGSGTTERRNAPREARPPPLTRAEALAKIAKVLNTQDMKEGIQNFYLRECLAYLRNEKDIDRIMARLEKRLGRKAGFLL
jgi:hypothetical protein